MLEWILWIIAIIIVIGASFYVIRWYLNSRDGRSIQVVPIPEGTTLTNFDDVARICSQHGLSLATTGDVTSTGNVRYTYCLPGYVTNQIVTPIAPGTNLPGCTYAPGLNPQPATFPCRQTSSDASPCATIAFCTGRLFT